MFIYRDNETTAVFKMIAVSKNPVLYRTMPFGKHKGLENRGGAG